LQRLAAERGSLSGALGRASCVLQRFTPQNRNVSINRYPNNYEPSISRKHT
jgi:hypothetical protein